MTTTSSLMPTLYLSHGAPPLADDPIWPAELAAWSRSLTDAGARPRSILMVSAHWEDAPIMLSSTTGAGLVYDFWGFPQHYYDVTYAPPPATELAAEVRALLTAAGSPTNAAVRRAPGVAGPLGNARGHDLDTATVRQDQARGLDHGAYVPLVEMFPTADIPVLQLSLPTLDPASLLVLGRRLAPLRDQGVLIIGSGFTTHNLRWFNPAAGPNGAAPAASQEFDHWAQEAVTSGDVDGLVNWQTAPAAAVAHPRSEHWAPIYVAAGAALGSGNGYRAENVIDGFWFGLSKRSWQFNEA